MGAAVMSQAETFGERLRAEAGLAQEQLAELAGKVPASIGRWEADGRRCSVARWPAIAGHASDTPVGLGHARSGSLVGTSLIL